MRTKLEHQSDRIEAVLALHKVPARVTGGTVGGAMDEIFVPILGYEGIYEISNLGQVKRSIAGANNKYKAGKVLRLNLHKNGYFFVSLWRSGQCRTFSVHRLVALAFLGLPPPGYQVNHKNGNKKDNWVGNLEWVTPSENEIHSYQVLGKQSLTGEQHGRALLTWGQVSEIRSLYNTGNYSQKGLGDLFGVSSSTIWGVVNFVTWQEENRL